ncbi:Gfo/Idh/MocA family protein [Listeria costaricensis]|uniref:Gfo/Idh/MocA family protein n=1 Tax=Listeria costaricensis TaxID=2026604 RepID=UPI000C077E04|nr:Gfo/Idh/MocA family oxidoreductase [Listeria costaricensis]
MRLGIIGHGMIVQDVLPVLEKIPEIQLAAIYGRPSAGEHLAELQNKFGLAAVFTDWEAFLAEQTIDTVYIALPNHLHFSFAKQALLAGKHVICEKPFTSNLAELEELAAVAEAGHLLLLEAITNQYSPNYQAIREQLPKIGPVKIIQANYSQYSSRYDAFKAGTILPAFDPAKSGGALMDLNSYNLHFLVGLFGRPKRLDYAANLAQGIDTSGILSLDYGAFKAVLIGAKDCAATSSVTIQAENGTLEVNGPANTVPSVTWTDRISGESSTIDLRTEPHRMYDEFVAFAKIIDQQDFTAAKAALAHSLTVMELLTEARKSARMKFPTDA